MRWKDTGRTFGGAVVVYVVMAACGASDMAPAGGSRDAGGVGATFADGAPGGALLDALTKPVPDANAAPEDDIAFEGCSQSFSIGGAANKYAEHLYPGVTANELAATVVAVAELADPKLAPPGYRHQYLSGGWIRDGAVAFNCGSAYTGVTFIRRR